MAKSLVNNVYKYFNTQNNFDILGRNQQILKIGNVLNSIFINREDMNIPKLVVVGSQSSGKSSILNSILGIDILPTGSNMVTRGPLQLELIQTSGETKAIFGEYITGVWVEIKSVELTFPNPTPEQKLEINSLIKSLTDTYAGNEMNITETPIYLRIYSPDIPNLSLVDLPGLTMIACTDKGQPKDIKLIIRKLIAKYISDSDTIIMAVMPARTDLEADLALDLIKEHDPEGLRTVGILTKLDLMNDGTDITKYLENKISRDLQLKMGYFGVKNRNKIQSTELSALEGLKIEEEFLKSHPVYSNPKYHKNLGIPALCSNLSNVLVKALKKNIPTILDKINKELLDAETKLLKLGGAIPDEDTLKSALIHKTIANLSRQYISVLEDRGKNINTARNIKNHFKALRMTLSELKPFSKDNMSDQYIKMAIDNCEGNHMSFPSPPVEVLEQILQDPGLKIFNLVMEPSQKCAQNIMAELTELLEILITDLGVDRFPKFSKVISSVILNQVLLVGINNLYTQMHAEVDCQENYIWTDETNFLTTLESSSTCNVSVMRSLASNYFNSIIYILQDVLPKKIMFYLVNFSQKELSVKLYHAVKDLDINELLTEYAEIDRERTNLKHTIKEFKKAISMINGVL
mgnify:CR=1 FL=1